MKNFRLDFRCITCASPACYGDGVYLLQGKPGRWYCREHVPDGFLPGSVKAAVPASVADQGRLL